jgi:hypothetical protein
MNRPERRRRLSLALNVESLEGRQVLSQVSVLLRMPVVALAVNGSDGSGVGAILSALNGGAGSEFVTLIRSQMPNVNSIVRQFALGRRTEFAVKGFDVKIPKLLPTYTGPQADQFNPTAAGAVILKDGRLELAAIMRGPIDQPVPTSYVWGLDRGSASPDPEGYGQSKLRYNATVSVTVKGADIRAVITDLKTGSVTALDPSSVRIEGPTIRVFLSSPSKLLPSTGQGLTKYRFSFWTKNGAGGIETIGSFVPNSSTILIGSLAKNLPKGN